MQIVKLFKFFFTITVKNLNGNCHFPDLDSIQFKKTLNMFNIFRFRLTTKIILKDQ